MQDLMEEIASPKYEDCWYNNLTYEHSGFRFQVRTRCTSSLRNISPLPVMHTGRAILMAHWLDVVWPLTRKDPLA